MNSSEQLFQAIRSGDDATLRDLLAQEPLLIQARDARGSSPLVLATYLGQLACAERLIEAGAAVDEKDATGSTPLMGASFRGHTDIVAYLLAEGARVATPGPGGTNALSFAQMGKHEEITHLLTQATKDQA